MSYKKIPMSMSMSRYRGGRGQSPPIKMILYDSHKRSHKRYPIKDPDVWALRALIKMILYDFHKR
jgi:hypothetical protein